MLLISIAVLMFTSRTSSPGLSSFFLVNFDQSNELDIQKQLASETLINWYAQKIAFLRPVSMWLLIFSSIFSCCVILFEKSKKLIFKNSLTNIFAVFSLLFLISHLLVSQRVDRIELTYNMKQAQILMAKNINAIGVVMSPIEAP